MSVETIQYERRGVLGLLRLNRPEALNAFTGPMLAAIEQHVRAAERDPEVVAICITGTGRAFSAGIDVSLLTDSLGDGAERVAGEAAEAGNPALFSYLTTISKPVIAAVNGVAAGGGFILAMMCDMRFVAEGAVFTTVFSRRGLIAEHGSSWLLPRLVGLSRALDLLWSSRPVEAAEAFRIGLADRVTPPEELIDAVESYAQGLADKVSPASLALMKRHVIRHLSMPFDESAREAQALMLDVLKGPDAQEGAMSFVERRPTRFARWTGPKD
jgi:enoyl-CoA hydratase/carnithine racemase